MLTHLNAQPVNPRRVVVLGGGGFIGGAILRRLEKDGIAAISLGRPSLDLLDANAAQRLALSLDAQDTLVFASAKAPCKDLAMLGENTRMLDAVCTALRQRPVAHVVYISSDAVYKDAAGPLTEASCAEPGSMHGLMHLTREVALRSEHAGRLAILRPTLVYGYDDPHNGYGPNRFRRFAAAGKEIVLFGEGEERRDHVFIDDVAELAARVLCRRSAGVLNIATGEVHSFMDVAKKIAAMGNGNARIKTTARSGPMPHNGYRPFDASATRTAFPDFRYTTLDQGLKHG